MDVKQKLIHIINTKGRCSEFSCLSCPILDTCRGSWEAKDFKYEEAVKIFIKLYSKEELLEELI